MTLEEKKISPINDKKTFMHIEIYIYMYVHMYVLRSIIKKKIVDKEQLVLCFECKKKNETWLDSPIIGNMIE